MANARRGRCCWNEGDFAEIFATDIRGLAASAEMRRDILLGMNTGAANQISKTLNKKQP
jgi:hypothetical protein